ncbi:Kinase phosphorylation domain-containing protein [Cinnamomum micranthum f. kanehirae]|uniref:Kinase phosphorylation domain-containing protein n=1 Tax=Cinnamomum micranthum f. kanehirae TaxID=337451 RepID=A0A443NUY1_9MAGN|nr:Kinase phosphorylation domain-containing protein [Cinnamomum micranthum f. kanehirae]
MYHPTRGGVRGGRDQFKWDDVKVDKHRENYLGHSLKAPVGRWQKGKDLHWYTRDKKSEQDTEAAKEEIKRIKEEEEQAMREALGLAPKRSNRSQGNRLDKHEFSELVKRGSTAEDLGAGHAEAARVQGLGFSRTPSSWGTSSSLPGAANGDVLPGRLDATQPTATARSNDDVSDDESRKKRKREKEKKRDKHEEKKHKREDKKHKHDDEKHDNREKHRSRDSEKRKHRSEKEKRRHDSD